MPKTKIKLNPRQYALRAYLAEHADQWQSSKEIAANVEGYEGGKDAYKLINEDYHAINDSGVFDKIIIPDRIKGYKLATREEFKHYSQKAYAEAMRKLVYVTNLVKAAKMDGQGIIPGIEGYQREFYDKFVKEEEGCKEQGETSQTKSSSAMDS